MSNQSFARVDVSLTIVLNFLFFILLSFDFGTLILNLHYEH